MITQLHSLPAQDATISTQLLVQNLFAHYCYFLYPWSHIIHYKRKELVNKI